MVEILFSRNLIKILFATETFAMGVNMPARAVVFNSIRKHDGTQFRVLQPGEYTQMAGRAGRRGLDKVGTVITTCCFGDTPPPQPILRHMLTGSSTMLRSQFRLTYNMILNLLRVEEMSVESMIKRSFSEFATQRALTANDYPKLLARGQKTLAKLDEQLQEEAIHRVGAEDVDIYFATCSKLMSANAELLKVIISSVDGSADNVLQPGRVLLVSAARKLGVVRTPAMVLQTRGKPGSSPLPDRNQEIESIICMVLLQESYVPSDDSGNGTAAQKDPSAKAGGVGSVGSARSRYFGIYEIKLDQILLVASLKQKINPKLLFKENSSVKAHPGSQARANTFFGAKPASRGFDDAFAGMKLGGKKSDADFFGQKKTAVASESEAIESAVDTLMGAEQDERTSGLNPLDLRDSLKRGNDVVELRNQCGEVDSLVHEMRQYSSHRHPSLEKHYTLVERQHTLQERVDALSHLLSNESLRLFPDFLQRKAVLRTLGYLDESEAVCVKGRVACEVNTSEELIVTEMVFEGILNDLDPTEIVAALSALVYQQKSDDDEFDMEIPETLLSCCQRMKKIAQNLGQLQKEHGLDVDPLEYSENSLKFGLVHVVYEWALGVPFSNICELTLAQEGSIVRCITRLDELCREVRNCARVVGNPTLYRKMEAASSAIKRDIVFASSLYVS
jgi:antiviral helicase SKI2